MTIAKLLRTYAPLLLAAGLAAACGKSFSPGATGAEADGTLSGVETADASDADKIDNLSQDLLDKLKTAVSEEEAATIEEEIWDAWLVSGSPTVDIVMKRGLDYQDAADPQGARDMFDRAIAIRPDYAEAWNRRALLFFNDGKYDEAIADLESALTYEPRHFGAWIGLGMIFESIERPEAALRAYRKALEIHPHAVAARQGERRTSRIVEGVPI